MVYFVRVAVVALFLVSASVASAVTIDLGPSDFSRLGSGTAAATATGVRHSLDGVVRFPGGRIPDFTVTRNQLVPVSGVTNGLKSLVRSTPGAVVGSAALTALFAGIDWVMQDGVLMAPSTTVAQLDTQYYYWYRNGSPGTATTSLSDLCRNLASNFNPSWNYVSSHFTLSNSNYGTCYGNFIYTPDGSSINNYAVGNVSRGGSGCPAIYSYNASVGGCVASSLVPVTDSSWSDFTDYLATQEASAIASTAGILIGAGVDPAEMSLSDDVISGPVTVVGETKTSTSTDSEGNTTVTNETTTHEFAYSPTEVTNTGSTTATDVYTNGNLSSSTTTTTNTNNSTVENEYNSSGLDIPTDCEFMPTVCAFLDWFKEPIPMPDPDFPEIGEFEDTSGDFSVDFGGSCPEPYLIELSLFPPVSFSWQPLCSFAGYMKPMVIISALIFAAYISLGISRGNS